MNDKPTNMEVAIYLAAYHRDETIQKGDEIFHKLSKKYHFKAKVLKKNFEAVCQINDLFN